MRVWTGQRICAALFGACAVFGGAAMLSADENASTISMTPASAESSIVERTSNYVVISQETAAAPQANTASCNAAGCESQCGAGNCFQCCTGNWVLGAEALWLSAQRGDRAVTYEIGPVRADPVDVFSTGETNLDGLYITPRLWVGYQGERWGIMARYWRMNEASGIDAPFIVDEQTIISNPGVNMYNRFKAETIDLEATRFFCLGASRNVVSFGVRYAELKQRDCLAVFEAVEGEGLYTGYAASGQQFSGVGFTMGLTGLKPIGCKNAHIFYGLRGSVLWDDDARNFAETAAGFYDGENYAYGVNGAYGAGCDATMFIGEVQLGIQWNYALCCHCADAFLRFAVEYQYWDTNNMPEAVSTTYAGNESVRGVANAASDNATVNLIGFSVATGLMW